MSDGIMMLADDYARVYAGWPNTTQDELLEARVALSKAIDNALMTPIPGVAPKLTEQEIYKAWMYSPTEYTMLESFKAGVQFAEKHHGIKK